MKEAKDTLLRDSSTDSAPLLKRPLSPVFDELFMKNIERILSELQHHELSSTNTNHLPLSQQYSSPCLNVEEFRYERLDQFIIVIARPLFFSDYCSHAIAKFSEKYLVLDSQTSINVNSMIWF